MKYEHIIKKIKTTMRDEGISQRAMADMCGVDRRTICFALNNKHKPSGELLCMMADKCGLEIAVF